DELTTGKPDQKEGLYFGAELAADDPRVLAGTPLHGPNLFPAEPAGLRRAVLEDMAALTGLGHRLMAGVGPTPGLGGTDLPRRGPAAARPPPPGAGAPTPLSPLLPLPAACAPAAGGGGGSHRPGCAVPPLGARGGGRGGDAAAGMAPRPAGRGLVRLQHRRHA